MSIRPNFFGIDLEKFKESFGTTTLAQADELFKKYENELSIEDGKVVYEVGEEEDRLLIINALAIGGDKAVELENDHPALMLALLNFQEGGVGTDSNDWKYYHNEYFEALLDKVNENIGQLIGYFLEGRKVFEEGTTETEYPYAYLTKSEVELILEDMRINWEIYNDSEGFGADLKRWMEEITGKNKDLFFTQG